MITNHHLGISHIIRCHQQIYCTIAGLIFVREKASFAGFGGEALFLCCLSLISEPSAAVTTLIFAAGCSGFGIAGMIDLPIKTFPGFPPHYPLRQAYPIRTVEPQFGFFL